MKYSPPDWRPIQVAAVGADPERVALRDDDRVADPGVDVDVERLDLEAVLERLDGRAIRIDPPTDRVDCVVVGSEIGDGDAESVVAAIREHDPDVPVIVSPDGGSVAEAADVTAAGATRYLPRDAATEDAGDGTRLLAAVVETASYHDDLREDRLAREMFRTVMEDFQLSIYFKDTRAQHVCVSSMVASAHSESVIGKTDLDPSDDGVGEHARESYRDDVRVIETGEPILEKEERHVGEHGEVSWQRTSKLPWVDPDGTKRGLVGITETINELKAREEALERERRRLEGFASYASHDLRNPISVASGYLELAGETGDPSALAEVEAALDRMDEVIDDVLALVRPGETEESFAWVGLAAAAEQAWDRVGADLATLSIEVDPEVELFAARGPLGQLLENLLQNAVDHAGPDVSIELGRTASGFYVADDGPGIADGEPEQVFEYGYTDGGTGLGLAIAREVAELHRWDAGVVGERAPSRAVEDAADAVSGRYDGATFAFDRCVSRTATDRAAVEGEPVAPTESVDVGDAAPDGESGPADEDPAVPGPDAWTVRGGGKNLWREIEEYHLAYAHAPGDVRIVARLVGHDHAHEYSKAGVLVSSWPTAGEPLSFVGSVGTHGCETIYRADADDVVHVRDHPDPSSVPIWLRVDRIGPRVTCFVSADGEDWTPIDQHVLDLEGSVVAGLAVCSHDANRLATANFDHVRIAPLEQPE